MRRSLVAAAALTFLIPSGKALADSCLARPTLDPNPIVCNVPVTGGACNFGSSDGVVDFPDGQTVTGRVDVIGGKNVWVGGDLDVGGQVGGKLVNDRSGGATMGFNNSNATGTYYIEGLTVDANGFEADVFAIRNHDALDLDFDFVNIWAGGQEYGSTEHGDIIQNQGENRAGSLNLYVENFYARPGDAQGFFIPDRTTDGVEANQQATFDNVYINTTDQSFTYGLLWFWSPPNDSRDQKYTVSLTDVWVNYSLSGDQIYPATGTTTGGAYDWTGTDDANNITGTVGLWDTPGSNGDPADDEAGYLANTGLNYDRTYFCGAGESPPYTNNSIVDENNIMATDIPVDTVNQPAFLFDGWLDDDPGHVAGRAASSFYVEFDLGQIYDMTNARIYGDTAGGWTTASWTMEVKDTLGDAYSTVFSNQTANLDQWFDETISTSGRYVKITVNGGTGTQANELDITGTVGTPASPDPPTADFTVSCTVTDCDFTDATTAGTGTVDTWSWDFDDGSTSTSQNPSYDFGVEGDYNVCLTATDDTPLSDSYCEIVSLDFTDETAPTVTWSIGPFVNGEQTIDPTITDASNIWRMQFLVNGRVDCTDTTSPFSCTWTAPTVDTQYRLAVRVTDVAGNETEVVRDVWSASGAVTDNSGGTDTTPPTVSFVSARPSTSVGDQYCFRVSVFDANEIYRVWVSVDGSQSGVYTETNVQENDICFTPDERRFYYLRAQAVDTAGNKTVEVHKVRAH